MTEKEKTILQSVWLSGSNRVTLKKNNKAYLNDVYLMSNVESLSYASGTNNKSALLVRKDGSVWKLNLGGKELLTKVRSGKIENKKISKPTNLSVTQQGKTKVKVKWQKVEGASQYTVYRSTTKNGKYKKIGTSETGSYTDKTVKRGATYYYKVVANHSNSTFNSEQTSPKKIKLSK